jgi:hypothetical protein
MTFLELFWQKQSVQQISSKPDGYNCSYGVVKIHLRSYFFGLKFVTDPDITYAEQKEQSNNSQIK